MENQYTEEKYEEDQLNEEQPLLKQKGSEKDYGSAHSSQKFIEEEGAEEHENEIVSTEQKRLNYKKSAGYGAAIGFFLFMFLFAAAYVISYAAERDRKKAMDLINLFTLFVHSFAERTPAGILTYAALATILGASANMLRLKCFGPFKLSNYLPYKKITIDAGYDLKKLALVAWERVKGKEYNKEDMKSDISTLRDYLNSRLADLKGNQPFEAESVEASIQKYFDENEIDYNNKSTSSEFFSLQG